jgi:hypothetical protein
MLENDSHDVMVASWEGDRSAAVNRLRPASLGCGLFAGTGYASLSPVHLAAVSKSVLK